MQRKLITGMLGLLVLLAIPIAIAYDASSAYTVNMRWIIPVDTTFSISISEAKTTIDFNSGTTTASWLEPQGQNSSQDVPMLNITNDGNVFMNFSNNLKTAKPSWATIAVSNVTGNETSRNFDTTAILIAPHVPAGNSVNVYLWSNITSASAGTTTREYNISGINTTA